MKMENDGLKIKKTVSIKESVLVEFSSNWLAYVFQDIITVCVKLPKSSIPHYHTKYMHNNAINKMEKKPEQYLKFMALIKMVQINFNSVTL